MRLLIAHIILFFAFNANTQTILPAYKNGSWWLVNGLHNVKVDANVSYIDLFDQKGYAYFIQKGLYGVMNNSGEAVLNAEYTKIEALNYGCYLVNNENGITIYNASKKEIIQDSIVDFQKINDNYIRFQRDTSYQLLHLQTGKIFDYQVDFPLYKLSNYSIVNRLDTTIELYTNEGEQFTFDKDSLSRHGTFSLLFLENEVRLYYSNEEQSFPRNNSHIEVWNGKLSYFDGKQAHLIDLQEREEIIALPFEKIREAWKGGYNVYKNGKIGWVDEHLQLKIPTQYSSILRMDYGFRVSKNGYVGLIDKSYKMILDCAYETFYFTEDEMIHTSTTMGEGLFSTKTHKHILKPVYYPIIKNGNSIKAYRNQNLRTVLIDENHKVVTDIMMENVVSARQLSTDSIPDFDQRLIQQGWFYESQPIKDSMGRVVKYRFKWGIKNNNDSILLKPRYSQVNYINGLPIDLALIRVEEFKLWTGEEKQVKAFDIVDYQKARKVTAHRVLEMDTLDGNTRAFSRFETIEGHFLFYALDDIRRVDYFGNGYGTHVRYCKEGKRELVNEDKDKESINIAHFSLNGKGENTSLRKPGTQQYFNRQKFEEGKWNFLTPLGKDQFQEPFTFANDFYQGSAIVKRKSGWGIATKFDDSLLLACEFASVDRIDLFNDTLFMVRKNQGGNYYLNGKGERIYHDLTNLVKGKNDINLCTSGNDKVLMYQDQEIERSPINYIILNNNYYAKKEEKEYNTYSISKVVNWNTKEKPVQVLSDDLIMVRQGPKNAIYSAAGDTIVALNKIEVKSFPIGVLVTDNIGQQIISPNGNLIYKSKKNQQLLVDETLEEFAILKKGKLVQYNAHQEKLFSTKVPEAKEIRIISGRIILDGKLLGNCKCNKDFTNVEEVVYYGDGFFGIEAKQDSFLLYIPNEESPRLLIGRKLKYHGEGVFSYKTKEGLVVMNGDTTALFPNAKGVIAFQEGMGLIRFEQGYQYYYQNLRPVWKQYFKNATPFKSGYATIYEQEGWTIINTEGIRSTYGSFTAIEQIGSGLFQCTKKPLYGLIDNHGTQILPIEFESIRFVNKEIIQVVKDGEVGYYSISGKSIFAL